jgi:hypothetical protein
MRNTSAAKNVTLGSGLGANYKFALLLCLPQYAGRVPYTAMISEERTGENVMAFQKLCVQSSLLTFLITFYKESYILHIEITTPV